MIRRPPRSTLFPYRRSSDLSRCCRWSRRRTVCCSTHCTLKARSSPRTRSEEHTSELQSQSNLFFPLFFNDTATTEIYTLSLPTLFRSKSVLPVVEAQDSLLFYPLHFEGEEQSKNVVYLNSPPSSSVLPAVEYLMTPQGGEAKRFFMVGSDYVWPRTINKMLKGYLKTKGVPDSAIREQYVPFSHSNFQSIVRDIKAFAAQPGGQAIVVLTVVGDSIPAMFKEAINQGIRATDIPILGLDVVDSDLEGLDTAPLVGHLSCWCYFQNIDTPANRQLKSDWANYVKAKQLKHRPDMVIDPMVSTVMGINLWAQAATKAKSFEPAAVRKALAGMTVVDPAGYIAKMDATNQYLWRGTMIGSINAKQGFDILWKSKDIVAPVPYSPFVKA